MKPASVVAVAVCVYVILALGTVIWVDRQTHTWKDFAAAAGVGVAILTTLLSAFMSTVVAYRQALSARQLELLKDSVSAKRRASESLLGAAFEYYYVLKALERGEWSSSATQSAESKMVSAAALQAEFSNAATKQWETFWSAARRIAERVDHDETKETVWREESSAISVALDELKRILVAERAT